MKRLTKDVGTAALGESIMLTREEAAELCRLSPAGFDDWVKRGIVPRPHPGTKRWSRAKLKRALDGEPTAHAEESAFERWKRENEGRAQRH